MRLLISQGPSEFVNTRCLRVAAQSLKGMSCCFKGFVRRAGPSLQSMPPGCERRRGGSRKREGADVQTHAASSAAFPVPRPPWARSLP